MKTLFLCMTLGPLILLANVPVFLARIGSTTQSFCIRLLPESTHPTVYAGLVCGQSIAQKSDLIRLLESSQLIHLIVVSGSHLILLHGAMNFLFQKLVGRELPALLSFLLLGTYAFLTGFQPPCVRALLYFLASVVGRKELAFLYSLMFSLILNPTWIYSYSFQLSVTASLLLLLSSIVLRTAKAQNFFTQVLLTVGLSPLLGFFSGFGLLLNFLLAPTLSLVLFPLALVGLVWQPIVKIFDGGLFLLEKVLSQLPLSQTQISMPAWPLFIVYLASMYSVFHLSQSRRLQNQVCHSSRSS